MSWDIYGNPLRRGYCEVHPDVHQEYPCSICMAQKQQQSQPHNELEQLQYEFAQQGDYIRHLESEMAALAAQVEALEFNISEYNRLHNELNAILHPDGDGPATPSLCDLVSYVKTDLQALYAQLDSVKSLFPIDCLIGCGGLLNYPVDKYNKVVAALNEAPQHHLRELRADAGRAGFVAGYSSFALYDTPAHAERKANQYADQIRRGEVE